MSMSTMSSWFVKVGSQPPTGGVSLVCYDAATGTAVEQDLILGLKKPVGIAVHGDALYVADQENNVILRYDLNALLAVDRSGTLYTKCHAHGFCSIAPDGTVKSLANDFEGARGVAVVVARLVLNVLDRAKPSSGACSAIRVFPLSTDDATTAR